MTCIQTFTGRRFDFANPQPESVDIADIARGLSMQCRFNGHCSRFYSVAEHSVRASLMVPAWCAREALLHDAAEAYTGDVVKPLKTLLGESFASIEAKIERAIAERFGLAYPWSAAVKAAVEDADDLLLAIEARDLMGGAELLGLSVPAPEHQPITTPLTAAVAERQFLERFGELFRGHNHTGSQRCVVRHDSARG